MPNAPDGPTVDAFRLIDAYFDGVISKAEFEQLADWIRADRKNLRQFATLALLHSTLRDTLHDTELRSFFGSDDVDQVLLRLVDPHNIQLMLDEDAEAAPELVAEIEQISAPRRQRPEVGVPWRLVGYLSAAAALLFFLARWSVSPEEKANGPQIAQQNTTAPVEPPPLVATLTQSLQATWGGQHRTIPIDARLMAGVLTLDKGVVGIEFDNGARVTVEGPAQFDLLSADRMAVKRGRMVANVPKRAIGFTVLAESAAIVDLGTEFGVDIGESGNVEVHVLDGEVALLPDAGKSQVATETLMVGEARSVLANGSGIEKIAFDKASFLRRVPASPYELAVLKSRPLAFWRFGERADAVEVCSLVDGVEGSGKVGSGVVLGQSSSRPENGNQSAQFVGQHEGIDLGRVPELDFTGDFTIESWVMVTGDIQAPRRVFSSFCVSPRSGLAFGVAGRGFSGPGQPSISPLFTFYGVYDFVGTRGLQFNQWHHLVVTVDSDGRPTLYLDGAVAGGKIRSEGGVIEEFTADWLPKSAPVATHGRCYLGKNPPHGSGPIPPPEAWQGGIDEVAFFDRVLPEEEIKAHYDAGIVNSLDHFN